MLDTSLHFMFCHLKKEEIDGRSRQERSGRADAALFGLRLRLLLPMLILLLLMLAPSTVSMRTLRLEGTEVDEEEAK